MLSSIAIATLLFAAADPVPTIPPTCDLVAVSPWPSAGEGYRAQAMTEGEVCGSAGLSLALVSPGGRALWERTFGGVAAVRRFYGVPGPSEMQFELQSWISPAEGKPDVTTALPEWPAGAGAPEGFEVADDVTAEAWAALRAAARPLFCFDNDPGYQTCLVLGADSEITEIGRRATR